MSAAVFENMTAVIFPLSEYMTAVTFRSGKNPL